MILGEGDESGPQKLRKMRSQLGILHRSDGSCALEHGGTVIWCGINGPGDSVSTKRESNRLHIELVYKHACIGQESTKISCLLNAALHQTIDLIRYPRAALNVTLQELQSDGSEGAAALTATCLAVLDSGIAMKGVFCGVSVANYQQKLILDPNRTIADSADAVFTFGFMSTRNNQVIKLIACDTDGSFEYGVFEAAKQLAQDASTDIFSFFRETMQQKLSIEAWKS